VAVKRVDLLLRAFSGIVGEWHGRELKLLIVGDGELRDELRTLADQLGIAEQVTFVGQVSEPETYLHDMDVFVLPSRNEGAPLAVMESLAAGVPVVAMRDGGGAAELVERSGGGVIAEDDRGLTSAVSDLLADAGGRAALAERARTYAAQELDVRVCARRYVELYAGLPASSCHGTVAP
jgi:glycosyltransferase involved in cell wall biosynthesis